MSVAMCSHPIHDLILIVVDPTYSIISAWCALLIWSHIYVYRFWFWMRTGFICLCSCDCFIFEPLQNDFEGLLYTVCIYILSYICLWYFQTVFKKFFVNHVWGDLKCYSSLGFDLLCFSVYAIPIWQVHRFWFRQPFNI